MLTDDQLEKLKHLLKEQYQWPNHYLFKFIVPKEQLAKLEALFPNETIEIRPSKKGNYLSASINIKLESADVVIAIYQKASEIKDLISL